MSDTDRVPARQPVPPSVVAVRTFADIKHVVALLEAKRPALVVLHTSEAARRRCLDVLTGWAFGSGGELDAISQHAVVARPPGAPPVRLARTEIVSEVNNILATGDRPMPSREEEQRLRARSAAGDLAAQRVLKEQYAEMQIFWPWSCALHT